MRCHSTACFCEHQGTEDEVIDIVHGKRLHELAKNPAKTPPLWAEGHNHQVRVHLCLPSSLCLAPSRFFALSTVKAIPLVRHHPPQSLVTCS